MENINVYVLLGLSLFCYVLNNVLVNVFSKKYVKYQIDYYVYNLVTAVVTIIMLIAITGGIPKISWYTLILGIVFGIATFYTAMTKMQALNIGPMSYTNMIVTVSLIIPSMSGKIFWNEEVSAFQYIGIVFMIICLLLSTEKDKDEDKKKVGMRWFIFCMLCFFLNGAIGVMQKFHQNSDYSEEIYGFLIVSFVVSTVFSLVLYVNSEFISKKTQGTFKRSAKPKTLIILILCGVCVLACNVINLYLSGAMDSMFFFPVFNGGGLILVEIASLTLFREKLTKKQWIGMLSGIIAVAMLCIQK